MKLSLRFLLVHAESHYNILFIVFYDPLLDAVELLEILNKKNDERASVRLLAEVVDEALAHLEVEVLGEWVPDVILYESRPFQTA